MAGAEATETDLCIWEPKASGLCRQQLWPNARGPPAEEGLALTPLSL